MRRYTVDDVMKWGPCCERARVAKLFGRRRSVALVDMLSSERLTCADAVWCACHAMDDRQRRHFSCDCAQSVLHLARNPVFAGCLATARRYADGAATGEEISKTDEEIRKAVSTATDAWLYSTGSCATVSAGAAVERACSSATCAAVYSAAGCAAIAAGETDERETQRQALLTMALAGVIQ